jgi:hypothetical protein
MYTDVTPSGRIGGSVRSIERTPSPFGVVVVVGDVVTVVTVVEMVVVDWGVVYVVEAVVEVVDPLVVEEGVVVDGVVVVTCGMNPLIDIAAINDSVITSVRPPDINTFLFVLMALTFGSVGFNRTFLNGALERTVLPVQHVERQKSNK